MYLVLTVGGNEKGAREGAALEIFFFLALWATILNKNEWPSSISTNSST